MIQRVQTLYLLALIAVIAFMLVTDSKISTGSSTQNNLKTSYSLGIRTTALQTTHTVVSGINYGIVSCLILSLLLSAMTIFQFKNLGFQKKLCKVNFGLISMACFFVLYAHFSVTSNPGILWEPQFSYSALLLFIPLLMNYFALRGISKDLDTLASADRLR